MADKTPRKLPGDTEFLKKLRDRFKLADDADQPQAQREKDDIAFEDGVQWPATVLQQRLGQQPTNGGPANPQRPTLVINKVKEPVRQILNQERQADLGLELVPADDFGDLGITPDDTEITLREGITRRIQRDSNAADARTWAFKRAVIAGRGYYMVLTRYLPGRTMDQEVYVHRIFNQEAVKLDPAHQACDGSDADWEFMGTWMAWEKFKQVHKKDIHGKTNPFLNTSDSEFIAITEEYPQWYRGGDKQEPAVRITDYYYREYTSREIAQTAEGQIYWNEEAPTDATPEEAAEYLPEGAEVVDSRTVQDSIIKFCKVAGGIMVLEETEWPSTFMPIVKVVGDEVLPYDEQRRYNGVVRPAKDAAQAENYMISKFVETVGLSPVNNTIIDPEAIDGYEAEWAQMNIRPQTPLPYRTRDDEGREFDKPSRLPGDPTALPLAQGIQLFESFIQSLTGGSAPDRVGASKSVQSGRAIRQLQEEDAFNTSNFMDNLARSVTYEGRIINSLLYPVYGNRPGRMVRVMTGEGENQTIQVGDPQGRGVNTTADAQSQQAAKVGKLTKDAKFNVIVKITKNSENRRLQEASALGELIAAQPEFMGWFGDLYFNTSDIPQRKALADRAKVMLTPPIQKMLAAKEKGQNYDPQSEAQIAQLTEQVQAADAAIKELSQVAEGKTLEADTKLQIERISADRDVKLQQIKMAEAIELQRMKDATSIRVAEIAAETKGVITGHELQHEADALERTQAHEVGVLVMQQDQADEARRDDMAHDAALTDVDQSFQADQAEAARTAEPTPEAGA